MKSSFRPSMIFAALLLASAAASAQPAPPTAPGAAGRHGERPSPYFESGYSVRLKQLLRESREKRSRVVLRMEGEEVAGVVQDLGPDWVMLSNQEGQQILLQLRAVERAEIR